ncbi:MAG: hypothetical protein PV358_05845, partial [Acidimicrobiales bacterium]|nr:hypothetical protein [Acidimicrobiales bacterium]
MALILMSLVAASVGESPLVAAGQAPERPATLLLRAVSEGAAGGPFPIRLTRDGGAAPTVLTATTEQIGEAVGVAGVRELAPGRYWLDLDRQALPTGPPGGVWTWTELICDDEPVEIDLETGAATFDRAAGAARGCEKTIAWAPP